MERGSKSSIRSRQLIKRPSLLGDSLDILTIARVRTLAIENSRRHETSAESSRRKGPWPPGRFQPRTFLPINDLPSICVLMGFLQPVPATASDEKQVTPWTADPPPHAWTLLPACTFRVRTASQCWYLRRIRPAQSLRDYYPLKAQITKAFSQISLCKEYIHIRRRTGMTYAFTRSLDYAVNYRGFPR